MTHPPEVVEAVARYYCRLETGHEDLDTLSLLKRQILMMRAKKTVELVAPMLTAQAVAAERERCAKACDRIAGNTADFDSYTRRAAGMCAAAIRADAGEVQQ